MSIDWERARRRDQRWAKERRDRTRPIQSTVDERPATPKQLEKIRELCEQTGATMPDTSEMTTRGAHWTIKNLEVRARS